MAAKQYQEIDEAPDCPWHLRYLYGWYQELGGTRQSGMAAQPITFIEIEAWRKAFRRKPRAWEIRVIKQLDGLFMKHVGEEMEKKIQK